MKFESPQFTRNQETIAQESQKLANGLQQLQKRALNWKEVAARYVEGGVFAGGSAPAFLVSGLIVAGVLDAGLLEGAAITMSGVNLVGLAQWIKQGKYRTVENIESSVE